MACLCLALSVVAACVLQRQKDGCAALVNLHNFRELGSRIQSINWSRVQWDHESYFTFLVSTLQMALVEVISCLLSLALIQNRGRKLSFFSLPKIIIIFGWLKKTDQQRNWITINSYLKLLHKRVLTKLSQFTKYTHTLSNAIQYSSSDPSEFIAFELSKRR